MTEIEIVDTTTRDGNQSLWGATGLTTPDVLAIAPTMDRVGFHALDFTSSTHMAVSVRYHREDPWQRIRQVAAAMPDTPLTFLTTGTRFISWKPADADVIRLSFRLAMRNGIRRVMIADPMNDTERLTWLARMAREEGAEEVVVGLTYSVSEVHTDAYYGSRAQALAASPDIHRLYLKDPGGLLTPDRVRTLAPLFTTAFAGRPVELHSHCTTALAPLVYVEGAQLGLTTLHTAVAPLANGTSQPAAETTLRNVGAAGFSHTLDLEALGAMSEYFRELARERRLPLGAPAEYDAAYYRHQLPGGMVTTMRRQLTEMRRPELFEQVLDEVAHVRADLGFPIMVTPFSQFVGTQAVMNALAGERYANVPDEVLRYLLGQFGEPPAPVNAEVADRLLSLPRAAELRDVEPVHLEGARERFGRGISDEELLLRLTMPAEQVDAMVAAEAGGSGSAAAPPRPGRDPLVRLLHEVAKRRSITYLRLAKGDDVVVWRRPKEGRDAA
jgi:oxaloacetate decarboxylase alpha subunit